jgi:protein tyrosine/serine phosphatase
MWGIRWSRRRSIAAACIVALLSPGAFLGARQLTGNFHEVIPGELYRSAQLTPAQIASYHKQYGIKTIVNLRGEGEQRGWYEAEVGEARRTGIQHINFRMSARKELATEQAKELLAILEAAPKPLLIHCKAGSDRSGLASALYLAVLKKAGEDKAAGQLSFFYGHIPLWFIPEYAMERSLKALGHSLGFNRDKTHPADGSDTPSERPSMS